MATKKTKKAAKADDYNKKDDAQDRVLNPEEEKAVLERARKRDLKQKAQRLFTSAKEARKRYDWEWLTRDLFRRGFHFSRYNPTSKSVVLATRSNIKIPINLVHAQMRTIKNQITSVRPKWEVMPTGLGDDAVTNARYSGRLLDHFYDKFNLRRKTKETVTQGLMYSVGGPWQIGYDPDGGENGDGEVFIWLLDPFDFYIDPNATHLSDAEYVVKAVRKPLTEIKADPAYTWYENLADIHGEMKQAASEYKQFLMQALKYYQPNANEEEEEGAILYEAWIKVHVTERNMEQIQEELRDNDQDADDLRVGEVVMRKLTYLDFVVDPLDCRVIRRDDFPFCLYQADVNPMEIYGESWIKHVIPVNRVINALESSVFKFNYKYAIGRIRVDKNSGVRIISNEHGDIVEANQGAAVEPLPIQPLPSSYDNQITNMRLYLEDVGGAHEASMGRIPSGVKSGIGIAELKAADSVNQQDLLDGLEEFLIDVADKLLREISLNYDVPKVIKVLGKGGKPEHFSVIGRDHADERQKTTEVKIGPDVFDLAVIGDDNEIKVSVGTWLAHTKEARLDRLREYFEAGLIDQETFLENAEFADVDRIIRQTRKEKVLEQASTQTPEGMPTDEEIAEQENYMMQVEGRPAEPGGVWPQPEDDHQVHLIVHQEALGPRGDPEIEKHMMEHRNLAEAQLAQPAPARSAQQGGPGQPAQGPVGSAIPPGGVPGPAGMATGGGPVPGGAPLPVPPTTPSAVAGGGQVGLPPELMAAMGGGGGPLPF